MKTCLLRVAALGALATQQVVFVAEAQPVVTVNIIYPATNVIVHDSVYIAATVSSTFELQGVQAAVGGRTMDLAYGAAAYSNCVAGVCTPQPGWSGTLSLSGLPRGTNTLTVTATDHFSNTGQAQRNFRLEIPVSLTVNLPTQGTVARPGLHAEALATNDPSGTTIYVYQTVSDVYIGQTFAVATNTLSTNLAFGAFDGQPLLLRFEAVDSINQHTGILRQVYVQDSTNLVEVDHVSDGSIADVQPDRILFVR